MTELNEKLSKLNRRLEKMVEYQKYFYREIDLIQQEINDLKITAHPHKTASEPADYEKPPFAENKAPSPEMPPKTAQSSASEPKQAPQTEEKTNFNYTFSDEKPTAKEKSNLEKFIGENLISLIGIAILILGVGIGAKYAIDRDLISPTARIVFGYVFGFGLLGFAVRLKTKYHNFSSVLLSGSLAILYFITFAAHSYYDLIGLLPAFAVMFVLTDVAVVAALRYNRQVIAHFGLVGAYAIPLLLGGKTGNISILFAYIAVVNTGILALSVHKYWKPLFYSSFVFTWATFAVWFLNSYQTAEHFHIAFIFASIFFLIFYAVFLAYKLINKEQFSSENVALLLSNSLVYYGFGYAILKSDGAAAQYAGLFTLGNAVIHFAVASFIKKLAFIDRNVVHLLAGLGLIFVTIAVPVQLEGNWITIFWAAEAALLFWLGRTRLARFYEFLSYPPMILTLLSLFSDWATLFFRQERLDATAAVFPFFNVYFLTAVFVIAAFALIYRVNGESKFKTEADDLQNLTEIIFPVVLLVVVYNAFRTEIGNYWYWRIIKTAIQLPANTVSASGGDFLIDTDLNRFNLVSQIDYTLLFIAALAFLNNRKFRNYQLSLVCFALSAIALFAFITIGLDALGDLRASYLMQSNADKFARGVFHVLIRYVSYLFVIGLFAAIYDSLRQLFVVEKLPEKQTTMIFDLATYGALWWLANAELLNLLELFQFGKADKLGLTIFWGFYALLLIVVGIRQNKKYLRFAAFGLSALTLAKLFFYDIVYLDTISKTVVFVSLGISLLLISFLYNKYKHTIFEQNET